MDKIYIVTMHRWGDTENHSYFLGAYETEEMAAEAEETENYHRGNKYEGQIIATSLIIKKPNEKFIDDNKWIKQLPVIFNEEDDKKNPEVNDKKSIEDRLASLERSRGIFNMSYLPYFISTERRVTVLEGQNWKQENGEILE